MDTTAKNIRTKAMLLNEETPLQNMKTHWIIFLVPGLLTLFALWIYAFDPIEHVTSKIIIVSVLFVALLKFVPRFIQYRFTEILITDIRVIASTGMLFTEARAARHVDQDNIEVERTPLGRLLNYGTIHLVSPGNNGMAFICVNDPYQIARLIDQQKQTISAG